VAQLYIWGDSLVIFHRVSLLSVWKLESWEAVKLGSWEAWRLGSWEAMKPGGWKELSPILF